MDRNAPGYLQADYDAKAETYYAAARRDWLDPMKPDASLAVIELGCGSGATGAVALREGKAGVWVGIEMNPRAARQAQYALTDVITGDIAEVEIPYPTESFDLLVCGEVLEHLTDPERALGRLVPLLKPGAKVLISTPNIAHWRILLGLTRGRFDYQAEGVMDRTHLRWFTPRTLRVLVEGAGLKVDRVAPLGVRSSLRAAIARLPVLHLLWVQIEVRARKPWRAGKKSDAA